MDHGKLLDRARDELFSHINRCGVLKASAEDQSQWMDETLQYVGERYPDLKDSDLVDLHAVGMRFCQPAIKSKAAKAALGGQVDVAVAEGSDANAA